MIKLDKRLLAVYNFVRENTRVADVGTDHGYLVCKLLLDKKITHGYACDINEGPLENAKTTARENAVENVDFILCDGLLGLSENCVDDIVIAGMGGELIEKIISECKWDFSKNKHFVLQPMTKADVLRKFLCDNGFFIEKEVAVRDGKHFYTVMSVYYTGEKNRYDGAFLEIGKLSPSHFQSKEYMLNRISVIKKRADAIKEKMPDMAKELYGVLEKIREISENEN